MSDAATADPLSLPLAGQRAVVVGPLVSMATREAARLLQQQGAEVVKRVDSEVSLILVGDEVDDWRARVLNAPQSDDTFALSSARVVRESDFWNETSQAGGAGDRLYTPAMLAEMVAAPVEAIRRWRRRGYLLPAREVGRLPYFTTEELHVARRLAGLLAEGCSLAKIDKLVAQLTAAAPEVERPLADLAVVVQEGRIYLRRGDELAEPHGQLLMDFEAGEPDDAPPTSIAIRPALAPFDPDAAEQLPEPINAATARALSQDLQAEGDLPGAIEACRAALMVGGGVEDHLQLAELLYQSGELLAARERYYMALEIDDEDVEARVSLGCVLAETGEKELAAAAFRGALSQQPGFADAHYQLARVLDALGHADEAADHWREFLAVAPASPWAEEAADRLELEPV